MHFHRAAAKMISERQRALPTVGHDTARHWLQDLRGITIRYWKRRNLEDGWRSLPGQPLSVRRSGNAGGQGIAGMDALILHRSTLHAGCGTPAAGGIDVALGVAIVGRIGIDQAADRSLLLSQQRLQSTPALAITGDDDLALHRHASARKCLIILAHAIIDVDHLAGDVAVALIGKVRRQRPLCIVGGSIAGHRRLLSAQHDSRRCGHLDRG